MTMLIGAHANKSNLLALYCGHMADSAKCNIDHFKMGQSWLWMCSCRFAHPGFHLKLSFRLVCLSPKMLSVVDLVFIYTHWGNIQKQSCCFVPDNQIWFPWSPNYPWKWTLIERMSNIGRWMYLKLRILSMVSFGTAVGTFGALRNALKSCQLSTIYNYVTWFTWEYQHPIYLRI